MTKVRVHELARELNVESKVLLAKLKSSGVKVASHQSTLTDQQVSELRGAFGGGAPAPSASSGASAAGSVAAAGADKPKVIVRRRAASTEPAMPEKSGSTPAEELHQAAVAEPEVKSTKVAAEVVKAPVEAPVVQAKPAAPVETPAKPIEAAVDSQIPEEAPPAAVVPKVVAKPIEKVVVASDVAHASELATPAAIEKSVDKAATSFDDELAAPKSPPAAATSAATESGAAAAPARRKDLGGATIVRRATPEEIEKMQGGQDRRNTGRKEDHRGTRVTGMGLLQNRISADQAGSSGGSSGGGMQARAANQSSGANSASPGSMPVFGEPNDWGDRRSSGPDRKKSAAEEAEEAARKKAALKNRRSNSGISTRALLQQAQEIFGGGDEEDASGGDTAGRTVYTPTAPRTRREVKRRKDLKKTQITTPRASYRVVEMGESITVGELSGQLAVKSAEVIKKLMTQGVMATINQSLDFDTASLIASEYGFEVKNNTVTDEDILARDKGDVGESLSRPPIVTIMGHVDHGKTSILDAIRAANVAAGEAGGITQHIGAYSVDHDGETITFLDTPGHEAFSSMRARGAKVTDIVVLVVAADDGVMPQTVEAISHAKAAGVPIIVAVNKIDKPNINLERIYTELTEHGIQAEEWGGDIQFIKVSALKRTGIDSLLEAILLQSEVLELQAPTEGGAEGAVIEAHLDKGRGPVATVIVQKGTLKAGDYIVAGTEYGRVRAMHDHKGKDVKAATPALPVEILGLGGVPMAGDQFNIVADEKTAREVASVRLEKARQLAAGRSSAASLADLLTKVQSAQVPEVPFIVKCDTQGSVEAVCESILKISTEKVKNRVIHSAVGGVTESDISLAAATGAILVAFNVRAPRGLEEQAERQGVVIRYFSIIYDIVDAVKAVMVGKLPPIVSQVVTGRAEVRKPINVPKVGMIAGSAVIDGKIIRNSFCRLIREDVVIYTGKLGSLRRFKDDVKEVVQGYECGIGIDGYNDLREGDFIEAYVLEETAATL